MPSNYFSRGKVRLVDAREILKQASKAMIHSSRRDRKTKAIAEVLAMIAAAELAPHRQSPFRETDDDLREESATDFSAALEKYCAEHASRMIKFPNRRSREN